MSTTMPTQADLTAIVDAGKRATPRPYRIAVTENEPGRFGKVLLAEEKPNGTSTVIADMVPGRKGANGDYLVLAANHADTLAATVLRVREMFAHQLRQVHDPAWRLDARYELSLRLHEARELSNILGGCND